MSSPNTLESFRSLCTRLGLGDARKIQALVERRERETGRTITNRRTGKTNKVVVRITENALRREFPELFAVEKRTAIAATRRFLADMEERVEQVAVLAAEGYSDRRIRDLVALQRREFAQLRDDIELLAVIVNEIDTRTAMLALGHRAPDDESQPDLDEGGQ